MGLLCAYEQDAVDLVHLDELDLDTLVSGSGKVLADVVGADGQFAVAAVRQHGELHALGPAVAEERLDRRADRSAGVEDVVHEDAGHSLEREVERGRANERLGVTGRLAGTDVDVVAVEGDVELTEGDLGARQLGDPPPQALRERHAARVNADERDPLEVGVALDDLVRNPRQRALDRLGVENGSGFGGLGAYGALRALLTLYSFPASQDRVKGV
jgi:hypothetical protein